MELTIYFYYIKDGFFLYRSKSFEQFIALKSPWSGKGLFVVSVFCALSDLNFVLLISRFKIYWPVIYCKLIFDICFGHHIPSMFLIHLLIKVFSTYFLLTCMFRSHTMELFNSELQLFWTNSKFNTCDKTFFMLAITFFVLFILCSMLIFVPRSILNTLPMETNPPTDSIVVFSMYIF